MKRLLPLLLTLLVLVPAESFAQTATVQAPNALGAASALTDTTLFYGLCQTSGGCDLSGSKPLLFGTAAQIGTYIGAATLTMTNKTLTSPTINGAALSGTLSGNAAFSGTVNFTGPVQINGNAMTFPTSAATLAALGLPQTWTGVQTYNNSNIRLLGSSTGYTTLSSANSGATNYTITIPAASDTVDLLATAQSFAAPKTFPNNDILLLGSSTGTTAFSSANSGATNYTITFPAATDTVDLVSTAQTITAQKTFGAAPSIASIVNTGTLTLPTTTGSLLDSAGANTLGGTYNLTGTFQAGGNAQTFPNAVATLAALGLAQTWTAQQTYSANIDTTSNGLLTEIANASTTGTTVNHLASLTGAPATAVITTAGATTGAAGVVMGGAGTTGNAQIARSGQALCAFDGATTAGDYVQISGSVNGDCHDTGSTTYPTSNQVLGRVLVSIGSAGNAQITVDTGTVASSGGGGSTTITAEPGLGNSLTTFNGTGALQTITNGSTLFPQAATYAVTANYSFNATSGTTPCTASVACDTARTILANGSAAITLTAPTPNGTLAPYSAVDKAGFGFSLTAGGASFAGCGTGTTVVIPANYGAYIYDQGTGNGYFCIAQPLTPVSIPVTLSWAPGQNLVISPTNVGIGLYTLAVPRTVVAISCRPEKAVGGSSDTIAVWWANSTTALSGGTQLTTTTCNANGTAATNQTGLLSAPVVVPAGATIGIVAAGSDWTSSAGAGSLSVVLN